MIRRRVLLLSSATSLGLGLAGCGGEDGSGDNASADGTQSAQGSRRSRWTRSPTPTPAPTTTTSGSTTTAPTSAPAPSTTSSTTSEPTAAPTTAPTAAPTTAPTLAPTAAPTAAPTPAPTAAPTAAPTVAPTPAPTAAPTTAPTAAPTPAPTAAPTAAPTPAPTSGSRTSYALNFAAATIENPLSAGGVWSNNTQGTGGNVPPLNMTSMCVGLAADGVTPIAYATHQGINYDDSFAFVPGFGANQWCEGVIYKAPGYDPYGSGGSHEVEIILGCRTANGYHRWNEFLLNAAGGVDILSLEGGPGGYTPLGVSTGAMLGKAVNDGDIFRATKVGNTLNMFINGVLVCTYTGSLIADGSGIGIAGFIRPGATNNKFGFRRVSMGNL